MNAGKITKEDIAKANRKGAREAELEQTGNGWAAKNKVHKSKKHYDRKRDKKSYKFY